MEKDRFIYNTLKPGTNSLKSTVFFINGIGRIRTKQKVKEALELGMPVKKKCKIMEHVFKVDYDQMKWVRVK